MVIIAGSVVLKVPQIINFVKDKSVEGVSSSMYVLETIGYTVSLLYFFLGGYPFSTYGENVFMILQSM
jgi:mannose-P-dolichol utilization defect 1